MKILKEFKKAISRNAKYCKKKGIRNYKEESEKIRKLFAEMKAELKEMNSRMNNPEKQVSDLEDRIREITQSRQQADSQTKKKKKWKQCKRPMGQ